MNEQQQLDELRQIRNLMERSSRFLSLSGLSGILIGIYALIAFGLMVNYLHEHTFDIMSYYQLAFKPNGDTNNAFLHFGIILSGAMVIVSFITAYLFTLRKSKKQGLKSWDKAAERLLLNLLLPLFAGGLFILALLHKLEIGLIAPAMLLFYGLALINASKYTFNDIRYLGVMQIIFGLIGAFHTDLGLILWAAGFGLLHIIYGSWMYFKYER